jgi:hypothetical protein
MTSTDNIWNFTKPNSQNAMIDVISEATFNAIPSVSKYYGNNNPRSLPGPFEKNLVSSFLLDSELIKYSQLRDKLSSFSKQVEIAINGSDYSSYCSKVYTKISYLSRVGINATDKNTLLSGSYILQDKKFVDSIITDLKAYTPPNDLIGINNQFITTLKSISETYLDISTQQNNDATIHANRAKFKQYVSHFNSELTKIHDLTTSKVKVTRSMLLDLRKTVN